MKDKELQNDLEALKNWDGHGLRGQAAYDNMFEREQQEADRHYCNCGQRKLPNEPNCGYDCGY